MLYGCCLSSIPVLVNRYQPSWSTHKYRIHQLKMSQSLITTSIACRPYWDALTVFITWAIVKWAWVWSSTYSMRLWAWRLGVKVLRIKSKIQSNPIRISNSDWIRTVFGLDSDLDFLKKWIFGSDWIEGSWIQKSNITK